MGGEPRDPRRFWGKECREWEESHVIPDDFARERRRDEPGEPRDGRGSHFPRSIIPGTILREGGAGEEPGEPRDGRGSHFPRGSTPRTILMGGSAGEGGVMGLHIPSILGR